MSKEEEKQQKIKIRKGITTKLFNLDKPGGLGRPRLTWTKLVLAKNFVIMKKSAGRGSRYFSPSAMYHCCDVRSTYVHWLKSHPTPNCKISFPKLSLGHGYLRLKRAHPQLGPGTRLPWDFFTSLLLYHFHRAIQSNPFSNRPEGV